MIYISSQPDVTYFIWQLEIQLRNFSSLGIKKEQVQVLLGYDHEHGLTEEAQDFIEDNFHLANFYTYPDLRISSRYTVSVRENLLKQHFVKFPELENETIFFHDSDILFTVAPQFLELEKDVTCYVADTRSYLDKSYILRSSSEKLLDDMLNVVGLSRNQFEKNDGNSGGAQYILKGVNSAFWEKVEKDSEKLYELMLNYNNAIWQEEYDIKRNFRSESNAIQAWCADMWGILWNLWFFGKKVEIHEKLNFSWPYSPIDEWNSKGIQHYSGKISDKLKFFKKDEYYNCYPWYDFNLDKIPDTSCSFEIVKHIKSRRQELDYLRPVHFDTLVLLEAEVINEEVIGVFTVYKSFIQKFLNIDVKLFSNKRENDFYNQNIIDTDIVDYNLNNGKYLNYIIIPYNLFVNADQIMVILSSNVNQKFMFEIHYRINALFFDAFSKMLDLKVFCENNGKFDIVNKDDVIIFLDKKMIEYYMKNFNQNLDFSFSKFQSCHFLPEQGLVDKRINHFIISN